MEPQHRGVGRDDGEVVRQCFQVVPVLGGHRDAQSVERLAEARVQIGETYDFLWTPPARGEYRLTVGYDEPGQTRTQRVIVR